MMLVLSIAIGREVSRYKLFKACSVCGPTLVGETTELWPSFEQIMERKLQLYFEYVWISKNWTKIVFNGLEPEGKQKALPCLWNHSLGMLSLVRIVVDKENAENSWKRI